MNTADSVFFYTIHKCASTLFGGYVLKNMKGLRHVDYAGLLYGGAFVDSVNFDDKGFVYGPIRVSAHPDSPVYRRLVVPTTCTDFVRDRKAMFMIRDPRDVLVSQYYSFGGSHLISLVPEIARQQLRDRKDIQTRTIDEYVLDCVNTTLGHFELIARLSDACRQAVVLRYEDMISDWPQFVRSLSRFADFEDSVLSQIYAQTRPRESMDISSHRRSGQTGQFRDHLEPATVRAVNKILMPVLERHHYNP